MNISDKLAEYFVKFPGIGRRQARRFVYFLLSQDQKRLDELAELISGLKQNVLQCRECFRFYARSGGEENICNICSSMNTDKKIMMVLEKDVDLENIRKTGVYNGRYFVIGGIIPLLDKKPTERVRAKELFEETKRAIKEDNLTEVIFALSVNSEGENTTQYLKKVLEPLADKTGLKLSILGRGLSTGTELEYSDDDTFRSALKNRG